MKSAAISISDIDVPKSGSSRMSPIRPTTTTPMGSRAYQTSSIRCMRRSSRAAMKKIALSFASSDGCTPMPPRPNHRLAPFTGGLKRTARRPSATNPGHTPVAPGPISGGVPAEALPEAVGRTYDRERSAVISRLRMKAPASQAGAACVPSSQSFTAVNRLMTAHHSQHPSRETRDVLLELPPSFCVIGEHVEARARRREQHDARRLRQRDRVFTRFLERRCLAHLDSPGQRVANERFRFADGDNCLGSRRERLSEQPQIAALVPPADNRDQSAVEAL